MRPTDSNSRFGGRDETQLGDAVELAGLVRELEERQQAGALARPEAVAQLLEVAGEEAGRIPVAIARLEGQPFRLGKGLNDFEGLGIEDRGTAVVQLDARLINGTLDRVSAGPAFRCRGCRPASAPAARGPAVADAAP